MARLPTEEDFPSNIIANIVPPSRPSDLPLNILLLLHGLGDSHESFTSLGRQMNLPETACISLRAPQPLLDLGGFHWGDDLVFDSSSGGLDVDGGFVEATAVLRIVVLDVLVRKCGYVLRDVVVLGFGQGGMAALGFAANLANDPSQPALGGTISIGAGLPSSTPASLTPASPTPILICCGSSTSSSVTPAAEAKLRRVFAAVELVRYRRPDDGMPRDREEMLPVMRFLARRLRSRRGVPEGAVEVS